MPGNNPHARQGISDKDRSFAPEVSLPLTLNEGTSKPEAISNGAVDVSMLDTSPDTIDNADPAFIEEVSLFPTLDQERRDRLSRYIASHHFIVKEGPVVRRQEWRKFTQEIRAEAATVGLDEEAIQRLIRYVRKLYRELYEGNVHYDDGSAFEVEEIDGGDNGHVKRKKQARRKRGSCGSTKSTSKKLKPTVLEAQSPVEDGSTALSTESSTSIPVMSEVTREANASFQTNLDKPLELKPNDALETRENKENDTKTQEGNKPRKQKTKRKAKVSHYFAKNRREGQSTASSPSGRRKNLQQSKPETPGKCSETDTAKSKEAREATIKARWHRKRIRRRERQRERKAQERAAKADGQSQATDSNGVTAGDDGMSKYFAGLPDQKTGKSKRVKAETGATDITAPVCGATVPAGVDQSLLDLLLSSDSSLSDVPSDVSSITVDSSPPSPTLVTAGGQLDSPSSVPQTPTKSARPPPAKKSRRKLPKFSPYFPKPSGDAESCLPFPPISAESFGLIQEQLAHNPFRLLLATIFLNRTRGGVAIPVLFRVFERYPTVEAMAAADVADVVETIHCLGFQNQRAKKCIELAKTWLVAPPTKGKRYRKLNYPKKGDGRDVGPDECIDDDDPRVAWEIAHLPGIGTYAIDSWRIFCRDELRGVASDWKGTNPSAAAAAAADFEPEWKRVLPTDKELRAYLTWMWLKEGWIWDRETGKRTRASEEMMRAAARGGLAHEKDGNWVLEMSPVKVSAYE